MGNDRSGGADSGERLRPNKQFLSVDFVTALSFEECKDLLRCCDEAEHQTLTVSEDGSFSLRRTVDAGRSVVTFWGTLEPVERGTWVWGTIFEDRAPRWYIQSWIPAFAVSVMLFMLIEALLRDAFREVAIWLGILLTLGIATIITWRWRYRHGLALVEWVYETLYAPPQDDRKRRRSQSPDA